MSTNLSKMAVLVSIISGKPKMTEKDRTATENAERSMGAHDAGDYVKKLYPKALIAPIISTEGALRNYVRSMSAPYGRNQYIVPQTLLMEVMPKVQEFLIQHRQAVTAFANNYTNVLLNAQQAQGQMFDPASYPDVSDIVGQFTLDVDYYPVPSTVNFKALTELESTITSQLEDQLKEKQASALGEINKDAFGKLAKQVSTIIDQVSKRIDRDRILFADPENATAKKQGRIHDSLIENLEHLIKTLPALNFTNDPLLNKLVKECEDKLVVHPDLLREDSAMATKEQVVKDAKSILDQMRGFV